MFRRGAKYLICPPTPRWTIATVVASLRFLLAIYCLSFSQRCIAVDLHCCESARPSLDVAFSRLYRAASCETKIYLAPTMLGNPGADKLSPGSPLGDAPVPMMPGVEVFGTPGSLMLETPSDGVFPIV